MPRWKLFRSRESSPRRQKKPPRSARAIRRLLFTTRKRKSLGTTRGKARVGALWDTARVETTLGNARHAAEKPSASRSPGKSRSRPNNQKSQVGRLRARLRRAKEDRAVFPREIFFALSNIVRCPQHPVPA